MTVKGSTYDVPVLPRLNQDRILMQEEVPSWGVTTFLNTETRSSMRWSKTDSNSS